MGPSAETLRLKAVRKPILQQTKRQLAFGLRKQHMHRDGWKEKNGQLLHNVP
jgi:hypothetical protein